MSHRGEAVGIVVAMDTPGNRDRGKVADNAVVAPDTPVENRDIGKAVDSAVVAPDILVGNKDRGKVADSAAASVVAAFVRIVEAAVNYIEGQRVPQNSCDLQRD